MTAFEAWLAFAERHLLVSSLWVLAAAFALANSPFLLVYRKSQHAHSRCPCGTCGGTSRPPSSDSPEPP